MSKGALYAKLLKEPLRTLDCTLLYQYHKAYGKILSMDYILGLPTTPRHLEFVMAHFEAYKTTTDASHVALLLFK